MKRTLLSLISGFLFCINAYSQALITVDTTVKYQVIEGFGGFGAKKVWWDKPPYWDQEYVNQVIDNLGCTFIRTQIYWESETPNDNNDPDVFNWSGFRFGEANDNNGKQMDFLKAAGDKGARIVATVWTPPIWMKGLEEFYGTYNGTPLRRRPSPADLNAKCQWCGGAAGCTQVGGRLKPEFYEEFAEYLAAYVKIVKQKTGHDVWAINIQNEPMFANPFESCVVPPEEYAEILKVVGEKFSGEGISTRLFGPEHMGEWSWGWNRDYIRKILGNPDVNPYLSFYAVHSYVDGVSPDYGSAEGWSILRDSITGRYGKQLWMTETSDFDKKDYDLAFSMAKSLYLALRFGHISGWIYWAMTDYVIKDNKLTQLGYAFKNFYRFIPPGSFQVHSISNDNTILVTAFKKDNNITIALINNSLSARSITLNINTPSFPGFFLFRTSSTENCVPAGYIKTNNFSLPPMSITTLVSDLKTTGITDGTPNDADILWESGLKRLKIENTSPARINITDLSGRTILNHKLNKGQDYVYLNSLSPGVYFVKLTTQHSSLSKKFIIAD